MMRQFEIEDTASGFWWRVRDDKGRAVMQAVRHEKSVLECRMAFTSAMVNAIDAAKENATEWAAEMTRREQFNAKVESDFEASKRPDVDSLEHSQAAAFKDAIKRAKDRGPRKSY